MFARPRSPEVFAATVSTSATGALVTHVLVPRSTQRSPRRSARVVMPARSEPAPGSVSANVATRSPRSAGTRYFRRSSSEPKRYTKSVPISDCMHAAAASDIEPRASSSAKRQYVTMSLPAPP